MKELSWFFCQLYWWKGLRNMHILSKQKKKNKFHFHFVKLNTLPILIKLVSLKHTKDKIKTNKSLIVSLFLFSFILEETSSTQTDLTMDDLVCECCFKACFPSDFNRYCHLSTKWRISTKIQAGKHLSKHFLVVVFFKNGDCFFMQWIC